MGPPDPPPHKHSAAISPALEVSYPRLDEEGIIKSAEVPQREADALPAGRSVQIFYDRKDPSKSLLKPGVPVSGVLGSLFGVLLVAGGLALVAIELHLRSYHAKKSRKTAVLTLAITWPLKDLMVRISGHSA